jgi:hypothetical protein
MDSIPWGQDIPIVLGPSLQDGHPEAHNSSYIAFRTDFMPASVKQARTGVFLIPENDDKDVRTAHAGPSAQQEASCASAAAFLTSLAP